MEGLRYRENIVNLELPTGQVLNLVYSMDHREDIVDSMITPDIEECIYKADLLVVEGQMGQGKSENEYDLIMNFLAHPQYLTLGDLAESLEKPIFMVEPHIYGLENEDVRLWNISVMQASMATAIASSMTVNRRKFMNLLGWGVFAGGTAPLMRNMAIQLNPSHAVTRKVDEFVTDKYGYIYEKVVTLRDLFMVRNLTKFLGEYPDVKNVTFVLGAGHIGIENLLTDLAVGDKNIFELEDEIREIMGERDGQLTLDSDLSVFQAKDGLWHHENVNFKL